MPTRRKRKRRAAEELAERAEEFAGHAKEIAADGGEAVGEFAAATGEAAKEFATRAFDAAKDMLETVERAGEKMDGKTRPARRRGRKLLKATIVIGAGVALATNEKVRNAISQAIGRARGDEPEVWTPPSSTESSEVSTGT